MTFSQKQYEKIVSIQQDKDHLGPSFVVKEIMNYLYSIDSNFSIKEKWELLALANPLTRAESYDKYIEKRYIWKLGDLVVNKVGKDWYVDDIYDIKDALLTEEQIEESPFKKEFLTKAAIIQ